jgi:ribosomal protein S18 acetylase RimI-like enzyme
MSERRGVHSVEHAAEEDLDACVDLWWRAVHDREGSTPPADTRDRCRGKLVGPRVSWRVVRDGQRVAAFGHLAPPGTGNADDPPDAAYLGLVAVDPSDQGRGLGTAVIATLLEDARAAGLEQAVLHVRVGNTRAVGLYERSGWVARGEPFPHQSNGRLTQTFVLDLSG